MAKKFSYENDILAIHNGFSADEKFKGCVDAGDLVLDVSTKGRVRGIEILDASDFLKDYVEKDVLENLSDAEFNAEVRQNSVSVSIVFNGTIPAKFLIPLEKIAC